MEKTDYVLPFMRQSYCGYRVAGCWLQRSGVGLNQWYDFEEYVVFKSDMIVANALSPFILKTSSLLYPCALSLEPSVEVYPNPASSITTIYYSITTGQPIVIQVIDFSGRVVEELYLGNQPAGEHLKLWNTETLEQGVYYLRLKGTRAVSKQVVVLR